MKLKIAQVIGLNTDQKAAQVLSDSRNGENYFFAVLDLACDDAFTRGRQILSDLSQVYFDSDGNTDGEKLKATFDEALKRLESQEFSLLLGVISGKVLYLISQGNVEVNLKRAGKVSALNFGASGQLISGFMEIGDRLLFATHNLITFLDEDLNASLELPIEEFEEEITDRIGVANLEDQGLAALLIEAEIGQSGETEVIQDEIIPNIDQEPETQTYNLGGDESKVNPLSVFKKVSRGFISFFWHQRTRLPKSNRGRLILAILLIAVLAVGVGFSVKAKKDSQSQVEFNLALQIAKDELNAAKGLSSLNPAESKLRLDKAKEQIDKALSLRPKNAEAQDLKKQIEKDSPSILQQFEVSEFPQFYDLDLVKKNFRATQMSLSGGKILVLDSSVKTLISLDIAKKSNQILAGLEQLGEAVFASLNGEMAFVYSKDKGVLKIDTQNQKVATVSKADEGWGEINDLYSFAGNVYLLDSGKNMIWKYLPAEGGYSDKREYINKTTQADLANASRMQIESSIYVLKNNAEVLRFTRGDKDHFSFEGLPSPVKDIKSIFVSSDTDNLYLLDSGNSRILILSKTGVYKSQIMGNKFSQVTDLVVDEQGKKVYLLDGGKIYQVDLK